MIFEFIDCNDGGLGYPDPIFLFRQRRDSINFGGGLASLAGVLYRVLGFASARTLRARFFCPGKTHKQLSFTSENRA